MRGLNTPVAAFLILVGLVMLLVVFYAGYRSFETFKVEVEAKGDVVQALAENSGILIELLVKVAFLAVALAAGSVVLGRGVDLLKGCPQG